MTVELNMAAVRKHHLAPLAHAGTLIGEPDRHVVQADPATDQHTQQRNRLGATARHSRARPGKGMLEGNACGGGRQLVKTTPQSPHALQGERVSRVGFAPDIESHAFGVGSQIVVQQRQPVSRLKDHLLGGWLDVRHDGCSAPYKVL